MPEGAKNPAKRRGLAGWGGMGRDGDQICLRGCRFSSEKTTDLPFGSSAANVQANSSGESAKGESDGPPEYENSAPSNSALPFEVSTVPEPSSTDLMTAGEPAAHGSPSQLITSEKTNSVDSSRHFFRIKNASCHEMLFIFQTYWFGLKQAKFIAKSFGWKIHHRENEIIDAVNRICELQGNPQILIQEFLNSKLKAPECSKHDL